MNFSNKYHNYYSARRYVTKSDPDFRESDNHPYFGDKSERKTSSASRRRHQRISKRSFLIEEGKENGLEERSPSLVLAKGKKKTIVRF